MEAVGVRFAPDDQVLVEYLRHHNSGHTRNSSGAINEAIDPYSSHPEGLPNVSVNGSYYYADREAHGRRTLDCTGYWKSRDRKECIKDGEHVIGFKRNLRFYVGPSSSKSESTKWVMTEYTLPPDTSHGAGKALCAIRMTAGNQGNEVGQPSTREATNQPLPNDTNLPDGLVGVAAELGVDYELPPEFKNMDGPPFS